MTVALVAAGTQAYPVCPESIPDLDTDAGSYRLRFARSEADLIAVQELRYRVFNLELGEGLDDSHLTGRDDDGLDRNLHHLMVIHRATGAVVGTYRMQTAAMAATGAYYSAGEFDLTALPPAVLDGAVEIGRACVDRDYRNGRVLHLLWRGLAAYLLWNRAHALFGCCSLTSQDPVAGWRMHRQLAAGGFVHPAWRVEPQPACRLVWADGAQASPAVPALFRTYLDLGAKVLGPPAIDREFKTIDWLVFLDTREIDSAILRTLTR